MDKFKKQKSVHSITVRFPLTRGDGDFPDISKFSKEEIDDIRKCLTFCFTLDYDSLEAYPDFQITEIEFLYDGISHIISNDKDNECGYWFENGEFHGYPAPIIRFGLNQKVSDETFLCCTRLTEFVLKTSLMEEPYFMHLIKMVIFMCFQRTL